MITRLPERPDIQIFRPNAEMPVVEHPFAHDPGYGYSLSGLLAITPPEPPQGFVEYWQNRIQHVATIDPDIKFLTPPTIENDFQIQEIEFTSSQNQRVFAWVVSPADQNVQNLGVVGHGYGGRTGPDAPSSLPHTACIYPCARGLGRTHTAELIDSTSASHVVFGLESRETYIHGFCVDDYCAAANVLLHLYPEAASRLYYSGGSFGGGIGALLIPWDKRFKAAYFRDPSFGHYPIRVKVPCTGSGQHISAIYEKNAEVLDVLKWFDAATAARFITTPTLVAASLLDPSVPPPGQFAVYNAIPDEHKELCIKTAGHFVVDSSPDEVAAIEKYLNQFLQKYL